MSWTFSLVNNLSHSRIMDSKLLQLRTVHSRGFTHIQSDFNTLLAHIKTHHKYLATC